MNNILSNHFDDIQAFIPKVDEIITFLCSPKNTILGDGIQISLSMIQWRLKDSNSLESRVIVNSFKECEFSTLKSTLIGLQEMKEKIHVGGI